MILKSVSLSSKNPENNRFLRFKETFVEQKLIFLSIIFLNASEYFYRDMSDGPLLVTYDLELY